MLRTALTGTILILLGSTLPIAAQDKSSPATDRSSPASTEEHLHPKINPVGTHLQQTIDLGLPSKSTTFSVGTQRSLLNVSEEFSPTRDGVAAGKLFYEGLEEHNRNKIREARRISKKLIPIENYGGEYTALDWFATYILASKGQKSRLLNEPLKKQYFEYFANNDFSGLKEYLARKYQLKEVGDEFTRRGMNRKFELELTMLSDNPRREEWEHTSRAIRQLNIQDGWRVAEFGGDSGYYATKLARAVGRTGQVYAIEVDETRLQYIKESARYTKSKNITTLQTDGFATGLEGKNIDMLIMSNYHNLYALSTAFERNNLLKSVRDTLKPDGMLYIVDNAVVGDKTLPYFGAYIAKELVIAQIQNFGFKLVKDSQPVPQRYFLGFRKISSPGDSSRSVVTTPSAGPGLPKTVSEVSDGGAVPRIRPSSPQQLDRNAPSLPVPQKADVPADAVGAANSVPGITTSDSQQLDRNAPSLPQQADTTAGPPLPPSATPPADPVPDARPRPALKLSPVGSHLQQTINLGLQNTIEKVTIHSQTPLVNVGLNDGTTLTEGGVAAGKLLYEGLVSHDLEKIQQARNMWKELIPVENYGGEYTALDWFAAYILAPDTEKPGLLADPLNKQFFEYYANDDFAKLKEYAVRKYQFLEIGDEFTREGQGRKGDLELTMLFNNPRREEWEHTTKVLKELDIKPGWEIADLGSGAGYYTVKFAKAVGEAGKVYAIELDDERIRYVGEAATLHGLNNIVSIKTDGTTTGVSGRAVDMVFMCSLYHNIYSKTTADERNKLMMSVRETLKPDGVLYIVDNAVVADKTLPYHGQYIAKELVKAQVENYGFKLVREYQPIPQRYMLAFKKVPSPVEKKH